MTVISEFPVQAKGIQQMTIDAFVRSVAVNRGRPICLMLGAGASISSGMPTAQRCIWEWKQDIFVTNNPTLRESVGELSLPGTKIRIQHWLDQRGGYPVLDSPEEYSFYAKECYQTGQDRRSYFQSYVAKAKPHIGYQILPQLVKAGIIRTVWTTNFDGLTGRACAASDVIHIEVGIDTVNRATRQHINGELRVVSLHGDFRYDELKNTSEELQLQEAELRKEFLHELSDHDLIVIGYSGRDQSLMDILVEAYSETNPSRLYWCGYGQEISEPVSDLLSRASLVKRDAFYVATEGFDDIISRLALRLLEGEILENAKQVLVASTESVKKPMAFAVPPLPATALVKSNAYNLTCPSQVLKLDLSFPENINRREWLDNHLDPSVGVIVSMNDGALAISDSIKINQAFGTSLRTTPKAIAISDEDINKDGRIQSLFRRALIQAIAIQFSFETDGKRRIWEIDSYNNKVFEGIRYRLHRALSFRLVSLGSKPHIVLMPEIVAKHPDGQIAGGEATKSLRNEVYGYQHNDVFNTDLDYWITKITNIEILAQGGATFRIGRVPIYAGLLQKGRQPLKPEMQRYAKQSGLVIADANLIFCASDGRTEIKNPNPLKGLVTNKPWDYQLTSSGLCSEINLGVICPQGEAPKLRNFLDQFHQRSEPMNSERDYLQDFPGFTVAFGLPLIYPRPREATWLDLNDSLSGEDVLYSAKQLAQRICNALDILRLLKPGAVVTIFVPIRWSLFEKIKTETEQFNLHDYIKAYAARHGQSTQFIREETLASTQPCRVKWWLSLAFYVKALRTPWRLDCLDEETAFVGIGYSIDSMADLGNHILMGCSHLYSARGEGLQFRLGRIENPIVRRGKPFMSEDDARRTGETIRQLFFDSKMRLPKRVVVYKRTPFIDEEQKGLLQGLEGVNNVELVEINIEESLRYLASKLKDGNPKIDQFPIPRGAVIIQNSNTALLWVHGSAPNAQNPNFKYFQGKRRIPAPLMVRRYLGQSDLVQVTTEILGLSKMNWNTFDYYSRLPATLDSASAIAKVGTYLSSFGSAPYDYRLLI